MTEDRDKWRKYVHGVANPWIENGYRKKEQNSFKKSCHLRQIGDLNVSGAKCLHFLAINYGDQNSWHR